MKTRFLLSPDEGPGGSGEGTTPEGEPEGTPEGAPQEGTDGQDGQSQPEAVSRSEYAKVTREAAKYRRERNELKERVEALEARDKSDLERERDRATKASEELSKERQVNRDLRVQVLASKVGITPQARADAARLLDWEKVSDPSDDAEVEVALRDLVKERPYLLGNVPGGADGGTGGERDANSGSMNDLLRAAAGRG